MNITLDSGSEKYWFGTHHYYSFDSKQKFLDYFFPSFLATAAATAAAAAAANKINNQYIIHGHNSQDGPYDPEKTYIFLSVENCPAHSHYYHYNKYGNYGNPHIRVFLYNHISKIEQTPKYIAIPVIYRQINYFTQMYESIRPSKPIPFQDKKFCIVLSTNHYRSDVKGKVCEFLSQFGTYDTLQMYKSELGNKSCYHSDELLNVIQSYKFAFVCENAVADGYVTEKIFNILFARTVPIYSGSPQIGSYINKDCFINANDLGSLSAKSEEIRNLIEDEAAFQAKIDSARVADGYYDEEYASKLEGFLSAQ